MAKKCLLIKPMCDQLNTSQGVVTLIRTILRAVTRVTACDCPKTACDCTANYR